MLISNYSILVFVNLRLFIISVCVLFPSVNAIGRTVVSSVTATGHDALPETADTVAAEFAVRNDFAIYYWHDRIDVDPEYLDNKDNLEKINKYLAHSPKIDSIVIYAYASPEGVYERNAWLSRKRAEAAKRYIIENLPENSCLKEEDIQLRPMAENWGGASK